MAELGIAASIVGLLATGAKLSVTIFDFASTVGSAEQELYSIGKEISLFCSVLEQVQNSLSTKTSHFSVKAVEAAQNITDHCKDILHKVEDIVEALVKSQGPDLFPSIDFIQKVKWTMKRPKVLQLQKTLESCKLTLHLMLTSSDIARKASSPPTPASSVGVATEKLLAQSLLLSQQSSIRELGLLEDEIEKEDDLSDYKGTQDLSIDVSPKSSIAGNLTTSILPLKVPTRHDRASIWLQALLPKSSGSVDVHPGQRYRRISSHDASLRSAELLEWWTVGSPAPSGRKKQPPPVLSIKSPFSPANQEAEDGGTKLARAPTDLVSPTTTLGRTDSWDLTDITAETKEPPILSSTIPSVLSAEGNPRAAVDRNDENKETSRLIPVNIRIGAPMLDIGGPILDFQLESSKNIIDRIYSQLSPSSPIPTTLAVMYGGNVRQFDDHDTPIELVSHLDNLGLNPCLVLQTGADLQAITD